MVWGFKLGSGSAIFKYNLLRNVAAVYVHACQDFPADTQCPVRGGKETECG